MPARRILACLAALLASALAAAPAYAQSFPARPIKIIVGFGAGGSADTILRLYSQKMSEVLGQPVLIENRPGAYQLNAIRAVQAAPADGYTLFGATGSALVQLPALRNDLPYDPIKDFAHLGIAAYLPAVIFTSMELPVRTVSDMVAYAAANPGKLNYGSAGVGTAGQLHVEALFTITGMTMTHIPYKADVDVIREVMAGTVQLGIMPTVNATQFVRSGKIRALAVTTANRLPFLPDVPSLTESSIRNLADLEPHTFIAIVGPSAMPAAAAAKLNETINKVSQMPDVVTRVRDNMYSQPGVITPAEFRAFIERELVKWRTNVKGVKLGD